MYEIYERLLAEKGVLTVDVCRATGIGQTVFSNWKKRKDGISAKNAAKIAEYFGVSVAYLMGQTEERDGQGGYYVYGDTARYAQEIFINPDLRILFDAAKDSRPEDLRTAAALLRRFKESNPES